MAGRPCAVCTHAERAAIDDAIIAGASFRTIAARYEMSHPAVLRHRNGHMTEQLAEAAEQRQAAEPEPPPATPSSPSPTPPTTPSPAEPTERNRRADAAEALDIVGQLKAINSAALTVLRDARVAGDGRLVLQAVDRVQRQIELQAKLIGQIDERPQVNIWISADWLAIEQALLDTLSRHPQARYEVSERLNALRAV